MYKRELRIFFKEILFPWHVLSSVPSFFFLSEKGAKHTRVNNVTKGVQSTRNGGAPYAFWIAIVPVPDTTPEIFRSIEPRALITRRSVRERLQGFSSSGGGGGAAGTEQWKFRGVSTAGDLSGCFSSNRPGAVTTVIFRGAADLGATNFDTTLPFRGYLAVCNPPTNQKSAASEIQRCPSIQANLIASRETVNYITIEWYNNWQKL